MGTITLQRKPEGCNKLIDGDFNVTHELKVYRNDDWQEFVAVVWCKANGNIVASYHTDDKEDAKSTGRRELANSAAKNITKKVKEV